MSETQTSSAEAPVTPAPAADRIAEIETVRDTNITDYFEKGLDTELLELRKDYAGETDDDSEGDDGDDGSEDVVEPGDLTHEDLALLQPAAEADAAARAEFVPDEPSGYELPVVEGHTWTAADEEAAAPFLASFHEQGLTQAAADAVLGTYAQRVAEIRQQVEASDAASSKEALAQLDQEWGADGRKQKIEVVKRYLEELPDGIGERIASARSADGRRLINEPAVVRLLAEMGQAKYAKAKPFSIADRGRASEHAPRAGYASEQAELMALMTSNIDEYNYGNWRGSGKTPGERLLELERGKRK